MHNLSCENKFCMRMKYDSISKAEHLPSFWNKGPGELGSGLLFSFEVLVLFYVLLDFVTTFSLKRSSTRHHFTIFLTLFEFIGDAMVVVGFWNKTSNNINESLLSWEGESVPKHHLYTNLILLTCKFNELTKRQTTSFELSLTFILWKDSFTLLR